MYTWGFLSVITVSLSGGLKAFTLPLLLRKLCMMPAFPLGARMEGPYREGLNLLKMS